MTPSDCAVLVFARTPRAGAVKTRLEPVLGRTETLRVYRSLLKRTLATARNAGIGPVQLWCTPTPDDPFLEACAAECYATLHLQAGADLGRRMHGALATALQEARRAILVGCDCPGLSVADLRQADAHLAGGADLVLGPAEDGGYYLVGLGEPQPRLFEAMDWGGGGVFEATLARAAEAGLRTAVVATRRDVDRPEDLEEIRELSGRAEDLIE